MLAPLRQRNFSLLWFSGIVSMIGDWMLFIGLPLYVYDLTNSTLATGITFMIEMLPYVFLSSVAGVFVDRWDRKKILIVADVLRAGSVLLLLLVQAAQGIWIVYLVAGVMATVSQFATPARGALLPNVVDESQLMAANSLNSLSSNLTRLIGPSIGGALIALLGFQSVVVIDSLTFVVSSVFILCMSSQAAFKAAPTTDAGTQDLHLTNVWSEWWQGLQFVRRDRLIISIFLITGAAMPAEGILRVMFAAFIREVLGGGSQEYGLISSAQAVGGLLGSFLIIRISQGVPINRLVGLSGIINGLLLLLIFNVPMFPVALVLFLLTGLPVAGFFVSLTTLLQMSVSDQFRGRVLGAFATTVALMTLAGMGIASVLGDIVGILPVLNAVAGFNILGGLLAFSLLQRTTTQTLQPVSTETGATH